MPKILIVEPHFDDAWINLGGFMLLNPDWYYKIVTLSDYATNYINGVDVLRKYIPRLDHEFLGYSSLGFDDPYMHPIQQDNPNTDPLHIFMKINNLTSLSVVQERILEASTEMDEVFWPLGIKHPQHIVMTYINPFHICTFYREFPYHFYPEQEKEISHRLQGMQCTKIDVTSVLSKKLYIFKKAYPSQKFIFNLSIGGIRILNLTKEVIWGHRETKKFSNDINKGVVP